MNRNALRKLRDILAFVVVLGIYAILLGYGMDLSAGKPRNRTMDIAVIIGAMAFMLILVIWYFRSGQAKHDWKDK